MVIQITDETLNEVLETNELVIIDFWAEWCKPCKIMGSILDEISKEYNVTIGKIDVDENNDAVTKYGIRNIPTILFIKKGQVMDKIVGTADKRLFVDKINKLLKTK
jgi:thioredoxin 1